VVFLLLLLFFFNFFFFVFSILFFFFFCLELEWVFSFGDKIPCKVELHRDDPFHFGSNAIVSYPANSNGQRVLLLLLLFFIIVCFFSAHIMLYV
jgi:hypothetical protein